ncbi:MAG: DUF362 domain-containing protein [Bacteroidetes bacterium]|nr:DUF362 domain-containing protein [Bacteroidota bacterium]
MNSKKNPITRRDFVKISAVAAISTQLYPAFAGEGKNNSKSRIIRIHDPNATKPWDYSANTPWNHTVEPGETGYPEKIKERYFDYINEDVVAKMLDRGLRELTDTESAPDAWRKLLPNLQTSDRIAIKMNMNNASFDESITTNRMDQTMPLVNVILENLVNDLGLSAERITILDASRWFHPEKMKGRCRFKNVRWVDHTDKERWDKNESVTFSKDAPKPGGDFRMPKAYTHSEHIINLCLMKTHSCGITGAMKNHFGSIPTPKNLHEGLGDKSYIADVCNTPSIRNKVRLNIADALFANWHNNVWAPRPWETFLEESPNSLIMGTDPVALDSVMLDHIIEEIKAQGENASKRLNESVTHHDFLQYAMDEFGLGIHEHRPYNRIDYRTFEA